MKDDTLARFEIRDIAERYFWALDRRDWDALESCFVPTARYDLFGGKVTMNSAAEVVARLKGVARYEATHHAWSNGQIEVDGAAGSGVIHAVAYCVLPEVEGRQVRVRGLRYEDRYARDEAGRWRIAARLHVPVWQFEAQAVSEEVLERQRLQSDVGR